MRTSRRAARAAGRRVWIAMNLLAPASAGPRGAGYRADVSDIEEDFFGSSRRSAMAEKVQLNEAAGNPDRPCYGD